MGTTQTRRVDIPLNRVEGDLELRVDVLDGVAADAWSRGIMYRGFENMLKGRAPRDGLVITPRICGICNTAHLLAAAKALDMICGVAIPANALIIRNIASMAEHLQSDIRHTVLMFLKDFTNSAYRNASFYDEAVRRYEPFKGSSVCEAVRSTKRIIELVAIIGGQWPNSSYMVPGGVANPLGLDDIANCRYLVVQFRKWYEDTVLGCTLERWSEVAGTGDLDRWYDEAHAHRVSEVGFFLRCCRETGLDRLGRGHDRFISFGQFEQPDGNAAGGGTMVFAPGFYRDNRLEPFDQKWISEHVAHARYKDYPEGLHPHEGYTIPVPEDSETGKYSFTKAPRYRGQPAETGPLAELLCSSVPLFVDLVAENGATVLSRQLARMVRGAVLIPYMQQWLDILDPKGPFYSPVPFIPDGKGHGLTGGCRGALGHWVTIEDEEISHYQIITPTAWNGSPRDDDHVRGPWEEAVVGTPVPDPDNPVELGHVIRSFDACQVCSVHAVTKGARPCGRKLRP